MRDCRSLLFVPGDNTARIEKAAHAGADCVIVDLEDAVAAAAKAGARAGLAQSLPRLRQAGVATIVRANTAWLDAIEDIRAAVDGGAMAIMVPKAEDPARLHVLAGLLGECEARSNLPAGGVALIPLIETAAAMRRLWDIADAPRVAALSLGTEDLAASMEVVPSPEFLEPHCRAVVLAAASRGLPAFAVPTSIAAYRDEAGFRIGAATARMFGAHGALCIHPLQVAIANEVFRPSPEEIEHARQVLSAWSAALARGDSVASLAGAMIDAPVVERAQRLLARVREAHR